MPRVRSELPSLTRGVSTASDEDKAQGFATEQINFVSDPMNKLTKRPPMLYTDSILFTENAVVKEYTHLGEQYLITAGELANGSPIRSIHVRKLVGTSWVLQAAHNISPSDDLFNYLDPATLGVYSVNGLIYVVNNSISLSIDPATAQELSRTPSPNSYSEVAVESALTAPTSNWVVENMRSKSQAESLFHVKAVPKHGVVRLTRRYTVFDPLTNVTQQKSDELNIDIPKARSSSVVQHDSAMALVGTIGTSSDNWRDTDRWVYSESNSRMELWLANGTAPVATSNTLAKLPDINSISELVNKMETYYAAHSGLTNSGIVSYNDKDMYIIRHPFNTEGVWASNIRLMFYNGSSPQDYVGRNIIETSSTFEVDFFYTDNEEPDDAIVAVNESIKTVEDLPPRARSGHTLQITQDSQEQVDDVYVVYDQTQLKWLEAPNVNEPLYFEETSIPLLVEIDYSTTGSSNISRVPLKVRKVGSEATNPFPSIVGKTIKGLLSIQNRLAVITDTSILLSEINDPFNFLKQSVLVDLPDDPIDLESTDSSLGAFQFVTEHNRDLLITTTNAQLKMSGTTPLTPTSASIYTVAKHTVETNIAPVAYGADVLYAIDYGGSSGIIKYSASDSSNEKDHINSVTPHVVGYLKGTIVEIVTSDVLGMILVRTDHDDTIYVYKEYVNSNREIEQSSWSKWELKASGSVVKMFFFKTTLNIIQSLDDEQLLLYRMEVKGRLGDQTNELFLDEYQEVEFDIANTANSNDAIVQPTVQGSATYVLVTSGGVDVDTNLWEMDNGTLKRKNSTLSGKFYLGKQYTAKYIPSQIYHFEGESPDVDATLKILRYNVFVQKTSELKVTTFPLSSTPVVQVFDEDTSFTGVRQVPFNYKSDQAQVRFESTDHRPCTISKIAWEGAYHQKGNRI